MKKVIVSIFSTICICSSCSNDGTNEMFPNYEISNESKRYLLYGLGQTFMLRNVKTSKIDTFTVDELYHFKNTGIGLGPNYPPGSFIRAGFKTHAEIKIDVSNIELGKTAASSIYLTRFGETYTPSFSIYSLIRDIQKVSPITINGKEYKDVLYIPASSDTSAEYYDPNTQYLYNYGQLWFSLDKGILKMTDYLGDRVYEIAE